MSLVAAVAPYVLLVTLNGVPSREIQFTTKQACNQAKTQVSLQYPYPERRKLRLTCLKQ